MSDTAPDAAPAADVSTGETPAATADASNDRAPVIEGEFDADRASRLIGKLRQEIEELKPLATKAKELEDSKKSETQRLQERAESLEKQYAQAQNELLRLKVAAEKGLPPKLAARLTGTNIEELEADADELLNLVATKKPSASAGDTLVGTRTPPAAAPDADAIVDKLRAAGRL